ncbi:hypothetical protein [Methanoculleus frigidifontis]|uniref:hypothetical protein n=1 Tax=Methanoculleus frigidifontis TaxID=2584085 RepID=UPI002659F7C2|nr:hypothetical protein [Methanoculleus sp. FWC-SCC1]
MEVFPVEAPEEPGGAFEADLPDDVVLDGRDGGRRKGNDGNARELLPERPEPAVLGPEVVASHRDAMRLVDGDEPEVCPGEEGEKLRQHRS